MQGKIIVIEGLDGTGKHTQSVKLLEYLCSKNIKAKLFSFPSYDSPSSAPCTMFLTGKVKNLTPYQTSILFAVDRIITYQQHIKSFREAGGWCIFDRYQSAWFATNQEKTDFIQWLMDFEYNKCSLPMPDYTFFLSLNFNTFVNNIRTRNNNKHGDTDVYEDDEAKLLQIYNNSAFVVDYCNWIPIDCNGINNTMKDIDSIHNDIASHIFTSCLTNEQ